MGDRTNCTLSLTEDFSPELLGLIEQHLGNADDTLDRESYFYDVNYGNLPNEVRDFLVAKGTAYIWSWDAGAEYASGIEVFDPTMSVQPVEFMTAGNPYQIVLTVDAGGDPAVVAEAVKWQAWLRQFNKPTDA